MGPHQLQAGPHVADTGDDCGEGGAEGEIIDGHQHAGQKGDEHVGGKEDEHRAQGLLLYGMSVQLDHIHPAGVDDVPDLPAQAAEQKEHPGALEAAARWSRHRRR